MRLSSYLPNRRIMLVWSEGGVIISKSYMRVYQAWLLIPCLHLWCFVDAMSSRKPIRGRAKFVEISVDKGRRAE